METVWRGVDETSPENLYLFLFGNLSIAQEILPSYFSSLLRIQKTFLEDIKQNSRFVSLICSKEIVGQLSPKGSVFIPSGENRIEYFSQEQVNIKIFVNHDFGKYPILIRWVEREPEEGGEISLVSFDKECLHLFFEKFIKKYVICRDYVNQTFFGIVFTQENNTYIREVALQQDKLNRINSHECLNTIYRPSTGINIALDTQLNYYAIIRDGELFIKPI